MQTWKNDDIMTPQPSKPMAAEERAENIFANLSDRSGSGLDSWDCDIKNEIYEEIAAEIREAESNADYERGYQAGLEKMRNLAARIVTQRSEAWLPTSQYYTLPDNKLAIQLVGAFLDMARAIMELKGDEG